MTTPLSVERWDEPVGATPRGTLIVLAGRGESAAIYQRFARRLSADAYRVRVVRDISHDPRGSASIVRGLIAEADVQPVVLVGSDAGSILALDLATEPRSGVSAVVSAGLPSAYGLLADEQAQLDARSACPVHRQVLADVSKLDPLALSRDIPKELTLPAPSAVHVPVLAFHGAADTVARVAEVQAYYNRLATARVAVVAGGRHDILNDITHRSVAATIVLFLEELRVGAPTLEFA